MAKRLGTNKEIEKLARIARKQGWVVEITRGNHIRFVPPDGGRPVIGGLSACGPGDKKFMAALRKAGLNA